VGIATNMVSEPSDSGGNVHVLQVAKNLRWLGHRRYTNLQSESGQFTRFTRHGFLARGWEIDAFYVRIRGHQGNHEVTRLREGNRRAPCQWEVNAPLEELRLTGLDEHQLQQLNERRRHLADNVVAAICVSREMEEYARGLG
jgi:hypothetical protein